MQKICKLLIISVLICSITLVSYGTEIDELQDKKNEIQTQIDESNNQLSTVDDELTENLQQIQKLDENIKTTEEDLEELEQNISNIEEEISSVGKDLEEITLKYQKQKQLLDTRLVTMYETENTNYLDVVLRSKSLSEFISSYYLIGEIASYDMDLLELVQNEKEQIELKSNQINNQKENLERKKRTEQKTQIALSNTKTLRKNLISRLSEKEQALQAQIDEYNEQVESIENEIKRLALTINFGEDYKGGEMKWPIMEHYTITSNYGMRVHPITGVYKLHTGVDIRASTGTEFTAIANGIVVKAEMNKAYGNMVIIDHGGGVQTLYAHGSEIVAQVGQEVQAGDVVLKVGSTGYSTGPHAHFEVRINGETVNPLDYVKIPEE